MTLFKITYVEDEHPFTEHEAHILCNGLPTYKQILKRINMLKYCGHIMEDKDYKEFVLDLGNYTKYNIEEVEHIEYIEFEN